MVAINLEGLFKSGDKRRALSSPLFFMSSMCSLLDATKAISIPEKKADKINEITIIAKLVGLI
jgi:hypothetical protein